jgi:hypothetical protein
MEAGKRRVEKRRVQNHLNENRQRRTSLALASKFSAFTAIPL